MKLIKFLIAGMAPFLLPSLRGGEIDDCLKSPHMVWSAETNSLRFGIWCSNRTIVLRPPAATASSSSFALMNTSTNKLYYFWPKELEQRFDIKLTAGDGADVPKTALGEKYGKALEPPPNAPARNSTNRREWDTPAWLGRQYRIRPRISGRVCDMFSVADFDLASCVQRCFDLQKPGLYKLAVVQRIYFVQGATNGNALSPMVFPPVIVDVTVEK